MEASELGTSTHSPVSLSTSLLRKPKGSFVESCIIVDEKDLANPEIELISPSTKSREILSVASIIRLKIWSFLSTNTCRWEAAEDVGWNEIQ
jgi:hypothetical protein